MINKKYNKKYQVGIIGATMNGDYGLTASYLALYEYISKYMKLNTTIIPPAKNKKWQESTVAFFNDVCNCRGKIALINYPKYQSIIDTFILGPGELWDYTKYSGKEADCLSYLNFLNDKTKRISYSTTFLEDYPTVLIGHPEKMDEYTLSIGKFSGLGVACDTDKECLSEYYGIDNSICTIDPIFLPKRHFWHNMLKKHRHDKEGGIVLYPLNKISRRETADNVSKILNVDNTKIATGRIFDCQEMVDKSIVLDDVEYANPPENPMDFITWLEKIYDCKYLMCADYYSLCFALIFSKNFIIFEEPEDKRVEYFAKKMGVEDRMVKNYDVEKIIELFNTPIDYKKVFEKITQYRRQSIIWLIRNMKEGMV